MEKFVTSARLRNTDFDKNDYLAPSALLEMFQDIAGEHADLLSVGFKDLFEKGLIWMVVRTKLEILKNPKAYDNVKVVTWPEEPKKIDMDRDYLLLDENDEVIAKATSRWVIVDYSSRRITRVKGIDFGDNIFVNEKNFDSLDKLEDFEPQEEKEVQSYYSDLDHNGHTNNTRYPLFILNAVEELQNEKIISMQIEYIKEIPQNSLISIAWKREGKTFLVKGTSDNELRFNALIIIK